jgi:hypothetical protein
MPGRSSRCSLTRARGGRGSTLMKRSSDRLEMGPERWLWVAVVAEDEMERAISAHRWLHVFFYFPCEHPIGTSHFAVARV